MPAHRPHADAAAAPSVQRQRLWSEIGDAAESFGGTGYAVTWCPPREDGPAIVRCRSGHLFSTVGVPFGVCSRLCASAACAISIVPSASTATSSSSGSTTTSQTASASSLSSGSTALGPDRSARRPGRSGAGRSASGRGTLLAPGPSPCSGASDARRQATVRRSTSPDGPGGSPTRGICGHRRTPCRPSSTESSLCQEAASGRGGAGSGGVS